MATIALSPGHEDFCGCAHQLPRTRRLPHTAPERPAPLQIRLRQIGMGIALLYPLRRLPAPDITNVINGEPVEKPSSGDDAALADDTTRLGQTRTVTRAHERCDACGFDGALYTDSALLDALRSLEGSWRQQLAASGAILRTRPEAGTWSAIEYAAHSRDITAVHAYGVEQAPTLDEPTFPPIADDLAEAAAVAYSDANPDEVLEALAVAAERLARLADDAGVEAWTRGLTIGDTRSDVRRLLEHALHDARHHLDDVERGLASLRPD